MNALIGDDVDSFEAGVLDGAMEIMNNADDVLARFAPVETVVGREAVCA